MRTLSLLFFLGLSFLVNSCGNKGSTSNSTKEFQSGSPKLILEVFAGYSCSSCNEELPELNRRIAAELKDQAGALDARVYVVAGPNWSKATQETADRYGRELGLTQFSMYVDNQCKGEYRKFYSGSSCLVPATVLLRPNGEVVEIYDPGIVDMDEFMARLKELLNE
ncbi:hypothetical protein EBQ90_04320 [bacterium]|nr:hypothetical protein [bacterium]